MAVLLEETREALPTVGEKVVLSGGRMVEIRTVGKPEYSVNGYAGKRFWRVVVEVTVLA